MQKTKKQITKPDLMPLSVSKIRMFQQCPFRFHKAYIEKQPKIENEAAEIGKEVHKAIEKYIEHLFELQDCQDIGLAKAIASGDFNYNVIAGNGNSSNEGKQLLINFIYNFALDLDSFYDCELKLAIGRDYKEIEFDSDDRLFQGIIDLLYYDGHTFSIIDFKTGRVVEDNSFQITCYAWLLSKLMPAAKYRGVEYYVRQQNAVKEYEITEKDMAAVEKIIISTQQEIKSSEFEPRLNQYCCYCEYLHACDKANQVIEKAPSTKEEAAEIGMLIKSYEGRLKQYKEFLKSFIEANGDLNDTDGTWTVSTGGVKEITDIDGFCDIVNGNLDNKKIKPAGYYLTNPRVDMRKFIALVKQLPELEKLVSHKARSGYLKFVKAGTDNEEEKEE